MGACEFQMIMIDKYKDANEAFREARQMADDDGANHDEGYSGTIYEKSYAKEVVCPPRKDPYKLMQECLDNDRHWCQDKWGPAAYIELKGKWLKERKAGRSYLKGKKGVKAFLFFGWAPE